DEADAAYFFGRAREQRIIIANLRAARLTLLYGGSGVGKSSVLRAGGLHQLGDRIPTHAGARGDPDRIPQLAVAYFSEWSTNRPVPALMERIRAAVADATGPTPRRLRPATGDVIDVLTSWTTSRVRSILVILDQFEEYFLYHPNES